MLPPLTEGQRAVVEIIAREGADYGAIADELDLGQSVVRRRIRRLCRRFGVPARDLPAAVAAADSGLALSNADSRG